MRNPNERIGTVIILVLAAATRQVLACGLAVLGVSAPEKM